MPVAPQSALVERRGNLDPVFQAAVLPDGTRPRSLTHVHLSRILAAEIQRSGRKPSSIRILDVGCGNGYLIDYLTSALGFAFPDHSIELFGIDVHDHGVQKRGFLTKAEEHLAGRHPGIDWANRLFLLDQSEAWPFPSGSFDFVVTNQVWEHVIDLDLLLAQMRLVMVPGGISINIFPVEECVFEGHTMLPFGHRVRDHDLRQVMLRTLTRLRLDRLGPLARPEDLDIESYGETRADYVSFLTKYRAWRDIASAAASSGFRIHHQYSGGLYWSKLGSLFGRDLKVGYRRNHPVLNSLLFPVIKRLSGITATLELKNTYDAGHVEE